MDENEVRSSRIVFKKDDSINETALVDSTELKIGLNLAAINGLKLNLKKSLITVPTK